MKRIACFLLIALMILTMAACTQPTQNPTTTVTPTTTVPATTAPKESPFVGSYSNNVYTNEFLGITCQLNADWTVFNEEQLAQLAGLTADLMDNEALKEQMEKGTAIYAFYGQAQGGQVNMNIVLERLSLINGILLDEKGYVEIAKDQLVKGLESVGLETVTAEPVTLQFAGAEHAGIRVQGTMQGVTLYETIACVKNGNYIASVVTASVGTDTTADLLALFKPLNG